MARRSSRTGGDAAARQHRAARVPLNRALSKLGILSRSRATAAILAGRVCVNGRPVHDPSQLITPERDRISVDDTVRERAEWRTIVLHKPRGVVTTRSDPEGRETVYDVLGDAGQELTPVGRLDLATTGLLILTTDTKLADWLTDPAHAIPRTYAVTVRGRVTEEALQQLTAGVTGRGETLRAASAALRKASTRESHLMIELRQGKNREVRRLFDGIGHEVTRLKRVKFGGLDLGTLSPGESREVSRQEIVALFPGALGGPTRSRRRPARAPHGRR